MDAWRQTHTGMRTYTHLHTLTYSFSLNDEDVLYVGENMHKKKRD